MAWSLGEAIEVASTLGATWTSAAREMLGAAGVLLQFIVAGNADAVGTIKVQGSNNQTNWDDVDMVLPDGTTAASYPVSSGVNSSFGVLVGGYHYFRVVYTRTSGGNAATLTILAASSRS